MRKRSTNVQLMAIFAIIIVTFFGSVLFFSTLNTEAQRSSMRTEADLSSSLLASGLDAQVSEELVTSGQLSVKTFESIFSAGDPLGGDNDVWVISESGTIYFKTGTPQLGNFFHTAPGLMLNRSLFQQASEEDVSISWLGRNIPFLMRQQCCVIRPLYEGRLFLVLINRGEEIQAMQRRQFALLMGIELVSMFVMVVLITNIIADYKRQIIRLATKDELTGLSNRKSFNTEFGEFMENASGLPCSLFLLDIDFFKQINDNYGHAAGDNALRFLAQQIQALIDEKGGFAGRWGGDEFIGVLTLPGPEAGEALEAMCRTIEAAEQEDGFRMTISVGVTDSCGLTSLTKLSEKADLALYESKEHGRNQTTVYSPSMEETVLPPSAAPQSVAASAQRVPAASAAPGASPQADSAASAAAPAVQVPGEGSMGLRAFLKRLGHYMKSRLIESTVLGVRWMAPFVAGGGILIGLAFLFDAASVDLSSLSVAARSQFGSITPLASTLKSIGGITFNFMLPVFAGFMAYGIAGEDAFMAGFVGGYMTIDSKSGFIGAMIAGFAAGVFANEIQRFTKRMPVFVRKAAPIIIYPVFNLLLMQGLSWVIITPLSRALGLLFTALLDSALSASPVIAGALSALMMATDMGGIINKVAYNYGVAGLEAGQTVFMAAVMIGGMVPPVGIFLSMLLFKNKYTQEQKDRGSLTLFMGLSFITEGALPYVFTDVSRVIPSCMLGSAVAGALSTLFGCELPAPHGGIFVLPVMHNSLLFLAALAVGSLVTAATLGIWKKVPPGAVPAAPQGNQTSSL